MKWCWCGVDMAQQKHNNIKLYLQLLDIYRLVISSNDIRVPQDWP